MIGVVSTANFDALDHFTNAASGLVVEEFGHFLANDFIAARVGFVFDRKFDVFFDFQCVETFDAAMVFRFGLFSFYGVGLLLRCGGFVVGGGF